MRTFGAIAFNNRCVSVFLPIYFLLLILNKLIELHWYWSDDTMTFLVTQPQCTQNVHLRSKMFKSSRRRYFIKKAALFSIFTWEHLCWILFFFKEVVDLQTCNLIKKRLQHRCFPVNILKSTEHLFWRTYSNGCFWMPHKRNTYVLFRSFIHSSFMKVSVEEYISSPITAAFLHERCS